MAIHLGKMKLLAVNATLHGRVELVEEFKASQQAKCDPDYEIRVWREYELKLARKVVKEEEAPLQIKGRSQLAARENDGGASVV